MNQFTELGKISDIVEDTGDIDEIRKYMPRDATTNSSYLYDAALFPRYQHHLQNALEYACSHSNQMDDIVKIAMDKIAVNFGAEISDVISGFVSTEVDPRLSFNTQGIVDHGRRIIEMYNEMGVDRSRILIKIASTYEGIHAAQILEKEGIRCNLTLLYSLAQAAACAEANVTLISPCVGGIIDWHCQHKGQTEIATFVEDPGVVRVREIYGYLKKFSYQTIVMGASFRSKDQILALAGCDKLTIAPGLIHELICSQEQVIRMLHSNNASNLYQGNVADDGPHKYDTRWLLNEDAMARKARRRDSKIFSKHCEVRGSDYL